MNSRGKLKRLEESRDKIIRRLKESDERIKEPKDNEEAWPGHESTRFSDDTNQNVMLKSHLELIEAEIKKLKR
jgi:hypothetical protein